jgi:voltage-gated potassium channel
MAAVVLQPTILDFLDVMFCGDELALELMEFQVNKDSTLVGKMLKETAIRSETGGALVVGIKGVSGKLITNPKGNLVIREGDILIALGGAEHLQELQKLTK